MITLLSKIFAVLVPVITFLSLYFSYTFEWWVCLLISVGAFLFVIAFFSCLILFLLVNLGKHYEKQNNPKSKKAWKFMVDVASYSCFWLNIRLKINGLEKLDPKENYVFYSNHQSYIDPLIYHVVLKSIPHATMYKEVINTYSLAAPMAKALGGESIQREDDRSAMESVIKIIKKVKSGINFFIFPEGTRSKGIGLHHFKSGSFKIVQKTNASMVVLAIDGSYRRRLTIPFVYTPVYVSVVKVFEPSDLFGLQTHEIASLSENLIKESQLEIRNKHKEMKPNKKYVEKFKRQCLEEDIF